MRSYRHEEVVSRQLVSPVFFSSHFILRIFVTRKARFSVVIHSFFFVFLHDNTELQVCTNIPYLEFPFIARRRHIVSHHSERSEESGKRLHLTWVFYLPGPGSEKRWRGSDSHRLLPEEDPGLPEAAPVWGLHMYGDTVSNFHPLCCDETSLFIAALTPVRDSLDESSTHF